MNGSKSSIQIRTKIPYECNNCGAELSLEVGFGVVDWKPNDGVGETLCYECFEAYRTMKKLAK